MIYSMFRYCYPFIGSNENVIFARIQYQEVEFDESYWKYVPKGIDTHFGTLRIDYLIIPDIKNQLRTLLSSVSQRILVRDLLQKAY